jgi:type IV pilus assembly protein PilM
MSVGLDIGSKTIKVIELSREGDRFALKAAGAVGYTGGKFEELEDEKSLSNLSQVVKKLLHDARVSGKNVSIALPESQVFTRILKFPLLNDQEIAAAVKWEAEEYIPIPIKEAVIEHQILERQEVGNPPQVLVLLVAVTRGLVEKYVKVANLAGLNVVGVETELMSLTRSLAPADKTALVVDLGSQSTDIAITKGDQLFFSRSVPTAGDAFSRAVAQSLGVTPEQAEQYKRTYGLAEDQLEGKVGRALTPIFKVVVEEIKKAVHYYELEAKGEPPSVVVLSGGSSGLPGASATFTKLLGIEVIVGNPFSKIIVDPQSTKNLLNFAPIYAVSVGLALRGDS